MALWLAELLLRDDSPRALLRALTFIGTATATITTAWVVTRKADLQASWRWRLQLASSALALLALAVTPQPGTENTLANIPLILIPVLLIGVAVSLLGRSGQERRAPLLAMDAAIIATSIVLGFTAIYGPAGPERLYAILVLGLYGGAGYACLTAARAGDDRRPWASDPPLIAGIVCLSAYAAGSAAAVLEIPLLPAFGGPSLVLVGATYLSRSAWRAAQHRLLPRHSEGGSFSRLRLVPALFAVATIALLTADEIARGDGHTGFMSVIVLFGLLVARLLFTLTENRELLRTVERSGVFEERLRDLGESLLAALDRREALGLACRAAQVAVGADSVILWMLDSESQELEAVEVLSSKRRTLLHRRLPSSDSESLAARVARNGQAEITSALEPGSSNGFLNVILRAQSLLAVPVIRSKSVHGVLVCVDSHNPTAYAPQDLAKVEFLASQVAVALDNAYQHALQRRRLEELSALYQFAQSVHVAKSGADIARQLLPLLRERLHYTYAAVWLRDAGSGGIRLAGGDGPGGAPLAGAYPSGMAATAMNQAQPIHAGLGWSALGPEVLPRRQGVRSQIAVPFVLNERVLGVVDLESRQLNAYSLSDERLLVALANHAALAIDNLRLLQEARKLDALQELDRMKTELLSTVSHELRTPLSSIKGYATTLLTHEARLEPAEKREFLEIIDSEADRLRELIENLLNLSRLEAGVLRIERRPCRLGQVAREVSRKVQLSTPLHQLECDWGADPTVLVDIRRIYQVIQNLLTNALKYSPSGGVIQLSSAIEDHQLVVRVADQGLGIPRLELARIFDRFHRVAGEQSQRIGGTGLGLAICKGLVEAHGGTISATSPGDGLGSVFTFTLPISPEQTATSSQRTDHHEHQEINRTRR